MNSQRVKILPYGHHVIEDDDIAAVVEVLRGEWLTTGPATRAFEQALATELGARAAVACSSGTAALHLAALALGLKPGDRVLVPAMTFLATANAARFVGADVAFADVDPDTALMGAGDFAEALERDTEHTIRAVFPVHMNGQCADLEAIHHLALDRGIRVVEDASHALGTRYQTTDGEIFTVGDCQHSDMAAFSFHPVKTLAMGEGGAVTTNDPALHSRLAKFRNHGISRAPDEFENHELAFAPTGEPNPWYYEMSEMGFNYRASDIHCALGLSQLGKLEQFVEKRRQLAQRYDELLAPLAPSVRPIGRIDTCVPAWHLYVVLIDFAALGRDRASVMAALGEESIGAQVHYMPLHLQPYYQRRYGSQSLPGAERYYARALSLPLFPAMELQDVDRTVEALSVAARLTQREAV